MKRRYRIIDFKRNKDGVPAKVATIEYDPNRSARIALLHYVDGEKRYILHPKGLKVGDMIVSGTDVDIKPGNAMPLSCIPVGTLIHAVELQPGRGAALARSAGTSIQLMGKEASTPSCACPPPKCAACCSPAAPPSARSVTPSTPTSRSASRP